MSHLILLRHGQSEWNQQNRFTGWADVELTEKGRKEALTAGQLIRSSGIVIDLVCSSVLSRCLETSQIVMSELGGPPAPLITSWELNERSYGALEGLSKQQTATQYGEGRVTKWRRSYELRPPPLEMTDERHPARDSRYRGIPVDQLPVGESLQDAEKRVEKFWVRVIKPGLLTKKSVLVVSHGNTIRVLAKIIEGFSLQDLAHLEIATGRPLLYEFASDLILARGPMLMGKPSY